MQPSKFFPSRTWLARAAMGLLALPCIVGSARASKPADPNGRRETRAHSWSVRDLLPFLQGATPTQIIVPAGTQGTVVDPSHLEEPVRLERTLRNAIRDKSDDVHLTVTNGSARMGTSAVKVNEVVHGHLVVLKGNAEIHGRVEGNVVALDGDILLFEGASIVGDALAIGGEVKQDGGKITGAATALEPSPEPDLASGGIATMIGQRAAGLLGCLLIFVVLGFAMVTFARPNLEIVSDTVSHSIGRAFVAGLLGELLVLPSLGLLLIGLALTIIGTVFIPFGIAVFLLVVVVALISGLLAVAYNLGETITRRRMAAGLMASPNGYRYMLTGLGGLATIWLAWVAFGWVPVAGSLMLGLALLTTWLVGTIGFGAALLSRGGIHEHFAGRLISPVLMTDEHLWATPHMGVPVVRRPNRDGGE